MAKGSLCVITSHFNPCGYKRPQQNLERFEKYIHQYCDYQVDILTFDDETPRERCNLFQKEALLNTSIEEYADQYEALAWVDADVMFLREDWVDATMRELESFPVVQMFGQAHLMDSDCEITSSVRSVGWRYSVGDERWKDFSQSHPGFAWAARSELLKKNKLYPYMITGCGDSAMLRGFTLDESTLFNTSIGSAVTKSLKNWAQPWREDTKGQMSFVLGDIVHMYHGDLRRRQNSERRYWMREVNPDTDLCILQPSGAVAWTDYALKNKRRLVDGIANYFTDRKEDD